MRKTVISFALTALFYALCLPVWAQQPTKIPRIGRLPVRFRIPGARTRGISTGSARAWDEDVCSCEAGLTAARGDQPRPPGSVARTSHRQFHAPVLRPRGASTPAWCPRRVRVIASGLGCRFWRTGNDFRAQLRLGASTPWKRIRCNRGRGTRAASRCMNSSGSRFSQFVCRPNSCSLQLRRPASA